MSAHYPSLEGRSVVVTGGATGIGAAHVEAFAAQGARVAFLDIDRAAGTALEATASGSTFLPCDLTDLEALKAALEAAADRNGPVEILVNNAADDTRHDLSAITPEYFDSRIAVNLRHLVFAAQAVAPAMRAAGRGAIINTGSISWRGGFGGMPLYMTAKAGIEGLTRALARDLGPDRIRVNCIIPGWVMTEKQLRERVDDAGRRMIAERQFLPDPVLPEDVSALALWLASDAAKACTAQCFVVDGGWI
ncbi:SDR family NAD(P)-dependent oxidoreductase [Pelagovum pacificum]|uniref:SDR family oxidoreductase n=1 Tax=Pelagovum pacificum TaxID=2588711 RepID=A0A5C5GF30_9RHOB|nr:SDR family oxidoreductase [Pelagovum pacificum]TNY33343.1 SDR family oxidoreductase [Pelagovum pacificum]